jgi:RHH-type proline utilization regulon transcriptional repressor/proline dehydrogenase/delta 1-pyrroline-5-carboxylate dehydrogenase
VAASEQRIREIGNDLFARMKGEKPGLFDKAWWSGQILEWAMQDPVFKTEMFRFVDVFPVLNSPEEIARHIQEYLLRPGVNPPTVIKMALKGAGLGSMATRIAAGQIAKNLEGMAKRFILGTDAASAVPALRDLRQQRQAFTVDLLGEATVSEHEAEGYVGRYRDLLEGLAAEVAGWKPDVLLEQDDRGALPRVNVSIKCSALYSQLDPLAFDHSVAQAAGRLLPLFQRARALGAFLNLDMEQRSVKEVTYALFQRVLEDPSLGDFEHAGVVVQAYLRDAVEDVESLVKWAKKKNKRVTIRLVKGAYWDYETVKAAQEGWPSPVWLDKADSDACFEQCSEILLANHKYVRTAIASHNLRSLSHAIATAEKAGVPQNGYEIQCLYGMAEPIKAACVQRGHRVRIYAPVGELLPGMAYLVRRLLENTSNQSWLRMGFVEGASQEALLAAPKAVNRSPMLRAVPAADADVDHLQPFCNEPLRDFGEARQREAFGEALVGVQKQLGRTVTPVIEGKAAAPNAARTLQSLDPADPRVVVGTAQLAGIAEADRAVAVAHAFFPTWRDTPVRDRAAHLLKLAAVMRKQRDNLSAWMVREVGKPWREADADVCEAIDFCEYYAREALSLFAPKVQLSPAGESNVLSYEPRGVVAVIAPWNFPLAILTGMAAAALVTGNPVVLKPAEQSFVIAARLMELCREAKLPAGALQFLPGLGEDVGAHLVAHRDVAGVAFTGSMAVGLAIWKQAGVTLPGQRSLKRVVCEMGGKNALIVDADADLDEAVLGTLHSAFGFAGQKCSACSRVIVLADHYDAFVTRLAEAIGSLSTLVGNPAQPSTRMGPVIDEEAWRRIQGTITAAEQRGLKRLTGANAPSGGYYIPPTLFGDVPPTDPLAQDEVFGPVLAAMRATSFAQALEWAQGTPYSLTGGLYSRSPAHIEEARRVFRVGNLYINRPITGAIVGRHPFGGFHMSGGGTKAGGPDYLLSFVDPRVVSENTMRRGFVPTEPGQTSRIG